PGVECIGVQTAEEMRKALATRFGWATVVIMAAAVADFRPKRVATDKVKKQKAKLDVLDLEPTVDILAELAARRPPPGLVGLAAETRDLIPQAKEKLARKGVDLIVANDVSSERTGIGSDLNAAVIVGPGGVVADLPVMSKREMADRILDVISAHCVPPKV